jgi:hypothetical protein
MQTVSSIWKLLLLLPLLLNRKTVANLWAACK